MSPFCERTVNTPSHRDEADCRTPSLSKMANATSASFLFLKKGSNSSFVMTPPWSSSRPSKSLRASFLAEWVEPTAERSVPRPRLKAALPNACVNCRRTLCQSDADGRRKGEAGST